MDIIHAEKYYEQIQKRFPVLSIKQIDKIVKFGLRSFFYINKMGGDVLIKRPYYTAYVGKLFFQKKFFWRYYYIKYAIKMRILDAFKKKPHNGKYYFLLSKEDYENKYLPMIKSKGRKKRRWDIGDITIYKLFEECALHRGHYIFEIDYPENIGYCRKMTNFIARNFRLVAKRDEQSFNFLPVG